MAAPTLRDPNFHRTCLLVCGHDDEGSLGLVLNRPTDLLVADYLPAWLPAVSGPPVVFSGGPVQQEIAVGLARSGPPPEPEAWTPIADDLGLVDLGSEATVDDLRVFAGYSGWSSGQLEFEISSGDWLIVPPGEHQPFDFIDQGAWRAILRERGGWEATYADFPEDPRLN